jgi:hypothetical protein
MVVVDGQDAKAFRGAADMFVDGLFDLNHWQVATEFSACMF